MAETVTRARPGRVLARRLARRERELAALEGALEQERQRLLEVEQHLLHWADELAAGFLGPIPRGDARAVLRSE